MKIKFRGKRCDNEELVEGDYIKLIEGARINHCIITENKDRQGLLDEAQIKYYVIPDTVICVQIENLLNKWNKRKCKYDLPDCDEFDGIRRDELELLIDELKEEFQ